MDGNFHSGRSGRSGRSGWSSRCGILIGRHQYPVSSRDTSLVLSVA